MTPGGWLYLALLVGLVVATLVVAHAAGIRLRRAAEVAMVLAVLSMWLAPQTAWIVWAVGGSAAAVLLAAYLAAGLVAEVQRWRETRR